MNFMEEHSAGGIIVRKNNTSWEILMLKDMNGNWTFPKGIIDPGENAETAAKREIQEEVGITKIKLHSQLEQISYWYVREGRKIHKTVSYFLFISTDEEELIPQTEEGISEVKWFPLDEAVTIAGYPKTNKPLLEQISEKISSQAWSPK